MIPCVWVLMKKRKTVDYKKVFSKLKKETIKNNLILKPKQIMTDMELGAMNAFKFHWPDAIILVCLFHVGQAFFKNFVIKKIKKMDWC